MIALEQGHRRTFRGGPYHFSHHRFERQNIQRLFGDHVFEPVVFFLELLHSLQLAELHPDVLGLPREYVCSVIRYLVPPWGSRITCSGYSPQSNGKVERFFRTINDECLHIRPLFTFGARSRAVTDFVWYYNHERPHFSLAGMTPVGRRKLYFRQAE